MLKRKLLLLSLACFLAIAVAEVVIALLNLAPDYKFYPGPFVAHGVYDYELAANHRGHQGSIPVWTDGRGMRIGEEEGPRASDYRVLILGDSLPFGWGVRYQETFAHLLEQEMRKTEPRVAVLNASVPGYSTWHEYQYLKTHIDELQPDLVILCFYVNDYVDREWVANKRGTLTKRGMEEMRSDLAETLFNNPFLSRHSGTYRLMKNVARDVLYSRHDAEHNAGLLDLFIPSAYARDMDTWPWASCFENLEKIQTLLKERDIKLHVLDLTENGEVREELTPYSVTRYIEKDRVQNTLPKDSHPNAAGHKRIYEQLYRDVRATL